MVYSQWSDGGSARHQITASSSEITYTATFTARTVAATMQGPTRLEVNLSYMPFDYYDDSHTASQYGFSNSCPAGSKIRGCFKTVLADLRRQGVSGVRILFGLCGKGHSTPLSGCGGPWQDVSGPNATWKTNVANFFQDVSDADIAKITLSPARATEPPVGSKPKSQTTAPLGDVCSDTPDTVYFDATSPFGRKRVVNPDNSISYHPIGVDDNNAWNCAPKNPFFVGWQHQYDVIAAVLDAVESTPNTPSELLFDVFELDFEQEMVLAGFPVFARFIVDNAQSDSGDPNVRDKLRYYMEHRKDGTVRQRKFETARVTWAAPWPGSTKAGYDCVNVYWDLARNMGQDQIASAIGGGWIGTPAGLDPERGPDTGWQYCGGTTDGMWQMPYYGTQPKIVDLHIRPAVAGAPLGSEMVESEATIDFNAIRHYLFFPFVLPSSIVVMGETWSNTSSSIPCEGNDHSIPLDGVPDGPINAASDTVAGYNESVLKNAGRDIVFRPWMQLQAPSGNCFTYPTNQRVNYEWGGPYAPNNF
ncbi:MAG: hypothetical protein KIT09_31315 [Bryobacteraceae bacterium]|nr:hypothetical protein [Bryobacteraceae bacterium]